MPMKPRRRRSSLRNCTVRLTTLGCLIFTLLNFVSPSWSSEANGSFVPNEKDKTVAIFPHPSGPTTRREWRSKANAQLYRVELDRARSGQIIFSKMRLIYNPTIGWSVRDASEAVVLALSHEDIVAHRVLHLKVGNQVWSLQVRGEELPVDRPGIATESENALDLTLNRAQ